MCQLRFSSVRLENKPPREGHVTGEAFERLHVCVCDVSGS